MEPLRLLLAGGIFLLLLPGCPGSADMPPVPDDAGSADLPFYPLPDHGKPPGSDVTIGDGGGVPTEGGGADLKVSSQAGDPCPCLPPLLCVKGVCRVKCTAQPCNGAGGCGAAEACVKTQQNDAVCVPGAAKGATCNPDTVCAADLLCLASGSGSTEGKCYSTCQTAGTACGSGGKCYALQGSTCLFCYP
jgi:hypothetical protein